MMLAAPSKLGAALFQPKGAQPAHPPTRTYSVTGDPGHGEVRLYCHEPYIDTTFQQQGTLQLICGEALCLN
jgi:hypothetical protein